jgi:hypothetical protein
MPFVRYFLHVQAGPQLQVGPHWQPLRVSVLAVWQPQVQLVPGQVLQVQALVSFVMTRSSLWLTSLSTRRSVTSGPGAWIGRFSCCS